MKNYVSKEKGITLISLIITIIIMLILAGVSLNMVMGDSSVLNQAITAHDKTIEGARKEEEALDNLSSEATSKIQEALPNYKSPNFSSNNFEEKHENTIQDGGIYYIGVTNTTLGNYTNQTTTILPGQNFPSEPQTGDVYVYGDYEYRFNQYFYIPTSTVRQWYTYETNSWGVRVLDSTKETYGSILTSINGYPVTNMSSTFEGCKSMTISPQIPSTITNMQCAYTGCSALLEAPTLPDGVKVITQAFSSCTSLKITPEIPESVESMSYTFHGCTSLTTATTIPENVESLNGTFRDCTSLTGTITINKSSIHASYAELNFCFWGTTKEIYLTGTSPFLYALADQSTNNNVKVLTEQ